VEGNLQAHPTSETECLEKTVEALPDKSVLHPALAPQIRAWNSGWDQATSQRQLLTPTELEILKWVRLGKTNREIGVILDRSAFTIKTHLQNMFMKTRVSSRMQLCLLVQDLAEDKTEED
jgi:DNA-binding CsgD family transcriptional regulator